MHARRTARQHAVFPSDMADALHHHQRGDFQEARWRYLDILEDGSPDPRLAYLMACLDIHAGDLDAAVNGFRRGIRNDLGTESTPSSAEVSVPTGFSAALAVDPRPGVICRQLAANLPIKGEKLLPALVALQAWLCHVPQDIHALERFADAAERTGAWLHQAHAWKRMGLTRKAAEAYRRAVALAPERPEMHFDLGAPCMD